MKAFVTGAGGLIGSTLCRKLLERGDEVRGLFLPEENERGLAELGVEIARGDITKPETLKGLADGCDRAFHLAARVEEWGRRSQFRETHYDGTRNVLRECVGKIERFVYFSSIAYYGKKQLRGKTEDDEPVASGIPYPDMKMLCEGMVRTYSTERGLRYTTIRPANVIGVRSAYVRNVLDSFRRGPVPLIEGGSYNASFVYVGNLVDGVILAADSEKAVNRAYNFCDDYQVTWREYLTSVGGLLGKKPSLPLSFKQAYLIASIVEIPYLPFHKRPLLTRYAVSILGQDNHVDTTRAREELGWKTTVPWEAVWCEIEKYVKEEYLPGLEAGPHRAGEPEMG